MSIATSTRSGAELADLFSGTTSITINSVEKARITADRRITMTRTRSGGKSGPGQIMAVTLHDFGIVSAQARANATVRAGTDNVIGTDVGSNTSDASLTIAAVPTVPSTATATLGSPTGTTSKFKALVMDNTGTLRWKRVNRSGALTED